MKNKTAFIIFAHSTLHTIEDVDDMINNISQFHDNCEFMITYRRPQLVSISEFDRFLYMKFLQAKKEIQGVIEKQFVRAKIESQEINIFRNNDVFYHPEQRMCLFSKIENPLIFTGQCSIGLPVDYLKTLSNACYRLGNKSDRYYINTEYITRYISLFASWDVTLRDYFFFFYYSFLTLNHRKRRPILLRIKFRQAWNLWIGPERLKQLERILHDDRIIHLFAPNFRKYFYDVHDETVPCSQNLQNTQESTIFPMTEERIIIVELRPFPLYIDESEWKLSYRP